MLGPSLLSLIFSLGVLLVSKAAIENQKIKIRKNLYLCLKSKEANLKKYINKMTYFNIAIRASFVAQAIPALSVYASRTHKVTKKLQSAYHLSYLKKNIKTKYCKSLKENFFYKTRIYKARKVIFLARNLDGTVPLKREDWKSVLWSEDKKIFIHLKYSLKDHFSKDIKVKRREVSKEAFFL